MLTKLRYDESVSAYAILTNDGSPFLAFALPDEIVPILRATLEIHSSSLKLMNIMTDEGIVILARVDDNWVLAVLFIAESSLGMALRRTKDVVSLLEGVGLPPPPTKFVVAKQATAEPEVFSAVDVTPDSEPSLEEIPLDEVLVSHGCLVFRGKRFSEATSMDTELNRQLIADYSNSGVDVLLMVNEERTVFRIAEVLARRVEHVLEVCRWCASKHVVVLECPEEQAPARTEIVEVPLFEGELKKAKKEHRKVLELCDGSLTLHDIARELDILYFQALQSVVPYRGKTLKFIRRNIEVK